MHAEGTGQALQTIMQYSQFLSLQRELFAWRAHEGCFHMHPIIHFDAQIPALFSVPADGTLWTLRNELGGSKLRIAPLAVNDDRCLPVLWTCIAHQLASAVRFIHTHARIAHVDIKPENILYVDLSKDQTALRCMLTDYGLCRAADQPTQYDWAGTPTYLPPIDDTSVRQRQHALWRHLALFEFATSLLDMLWLDQLPGTKAGGGFLENLCIADDIEPYAMTRRTPPVYACVQHARMYLGLNMDKMSYDECPLRLLLDMVEPTHFDGTAIEARFNQFADAMANAYDRTPAFTAIRAARDLFLQKP